MNTGVLVIIIGIALNIIATVLGLKYDYKSSGKLTLGNLVIAFILTVVPYLTAFAGIVFLVVYNSDKIIIGKKK